MLPACCAKSLQFASVIQAGQVLLLAQAHVVNTDVHFRSQLVKRDTVAQGVCETILHHKALTGFCQSGSAFSWGFLMTIHSACNEQSLPF